MPSRLLREGILDSEAVNGLTPEAEVFYRRLMSVVDDFGRFDGRAKVLRSRLYALRLAAVTEADVVRWVGECEAVGLVCTYEADGKPFLHFRKLGTPRSKVSKFPAPPPDGSAKPAGKTPQHTDENIRLQTQTDVNGCIQTQTDECIRLQMKTDVPYSYSGSGTYSDSSSGTTSDSTPGSGSAPGAGAAEVGSGRPETSQLDPLRKAQADRKAFVAAWNAAGLRPLERLTGTLQSMLERCLLEPGWADQYPAALVRAAANPWHLPGTTRANGPLDPVDVLRDADWVRQCLAGRFDPRPAAGSKPAAAGTDAERARRAHEEHLAARQRARNGGAA